MSNLVSSVLWHAWEETDCNPDYNVKVGINIRGPYAEKRAFIFSAVPRISVVPIANGIELHVGYIHHLSL